MAINTVITSNIMALTAHRNVGAVGNKQNKANKRLASGKKINSAADDAAGLAISEKMKAQIKSLDMASKNSEDAISLMQTAEGSLSEVNNMLTRVRELTVQASNDTNQQQDRVKIAEEVAQLLTEIDSISLRTTFNEKGLNDGSFYNGHFQIGSNNGQSLNLSIGNMSVLGVGADTVINAFGLEKTVDFNVKSTEKGILSNGVPASIELDISDVQFAKPGSPTPTNKNLTSASMSFTYIENGVSKRYNIKIDLSSLKTDNNGKVSKEKLAETITPQLNSALRGKVNFKNLGNGKIKATADKNGGESVFLPIPSRFNISYKALKNNEGFPVTNTGKFTPSNEVDGFHNDANIEALTYGQSLIIGGQKFTKVKPEDVKSTYNGFTDGRDLEKLLREIGISSISVDGKSIKIHSVGRKSKLTGTYSVNPKKVSDKGKDFSNLLEGIDNALQKVTSQRAELGSNQNRLEYTINNLNMSSENLSSANSRIEDTDMAKEMMNLTSANVLQQAATTILAQANQAPKSIAQLLGQ